MQSQHLPDVFTNGLCSEEAPGVGFAGSGVWFGPMDSKNLSFPLPGPEQTNNRAELSAAIAALQAVPAAKPLCVVTDRKCVYDGATTHLRGWLLLDILHWDLWAQVRNVLDSRVAPTHRWHVYSHVGVLGNERADSLANQGCLNHPGRLQFLRDEGSPRPGSSFCATRARHGLAP